MKKISFLLALMALTIFVLTAAVSAQSELPAIDEAAAAAYLGTWHADRLCAEGSCLSFSDIGVDQTWELNADNTVVVTNPDGTTATGQWYMEAGKAYFTESDEKGNSVTSEISLDEEGSLVLTDGDNSVITFIREVAAVPGSGEVVADAALEDFLGDWFLYGFGGADGEVAAVAALGIEGSLTISQDTFSFRMGDDSRDQEYILEDGKLYVTWPAAEGEKQDDVAVMTCLSDDSAVLTFGEGTDNTFDMIFSRKKIESADLVGIIEKIDPQAAGDGVSSNLSTLFESLGTLLNNSGIDLQGLLQGLVSQDGQGIDLNSLMEKLTGGSANGEGFNLNGLLESLTGGSENGEGFNLGGLLEGLTSKDENGETTFNPAGLLQLLGSGNK